MPRLVLTPSGGAKMSFTASAPPPVSSYRSMMRSAVSLPPRSEASVLAAIVSGMKAVSAPEASAIARSNPASFWNRLTTRSTKSGRSQNVSVRRTRPRSSHGCGSAMLIRASGHQCVLVLAEDDEPVDDVDAQDEARPATTMGWSRRSTGRR